MSDGDSASGDSVPEYNEVIITVPADMQAGVWANWARINEGDNASDESPPWSESDRMRGGAPNRDGFQALQTGQIYRFDSSTSRS